jgi:class 3 adenylate cyclase/tetratricopeptide (TPR) repeat protein
MAKDPSTDEQFTHSPTRSDERQSGGMSERYRSRMTAGADHRCPACGTGLVSGARFCPSCGTPTLIPPCASCGESLTPGARFCSSCGTPVDAATDRRTLVDPVEPVAERRVTSVLFGDLVGFTPLSESRDAEEVRELLSHYFAQCRAIVQRYGGTIEKFIGDAVMAVWGAPVAHEDDAERAVRAGLELTRAIAGMGQDVGAPGLAMRVGIVTGEVAVTIGATAEGLVAGDAVNTAARVQSVAGHGQVWVDAMTRTLASVAISFEDRGRHELKGKSEPMQLFAAGEVLAQRGGDLRIDGTEAPMIGRDRELRLLKELFHATAEARRPRLVILDGEPGIGKSRLAWEFEKYIDGLPSTVAWHRGRCLSYGDGVAFWALAEALRPRLGLVETDSRDGAEATLEESLGVVVDEDERDWIRPRLAALMGLGDGTTFAREDLFSAWTTFLERVGGHDPVILVIDDAQYADDGLLDFIDHLLATGRAGILVLALARPDLLLRRAELGGRRASVIRLDSLPDEAMAAVIDELVEGLPESVRTTLVDRADGVPLYAVETVRTLIDRGVVIARDGRYVLSDADDLDLDSIGAPASLQALVAARLDGLAPEERRVVTHASVLGASFTRDALASMTHPDSAPQAPGLDETLASLQRKEIISLQQDRFSAERGQYRFVQAVVRQVAYATQSKRDRKARHLAAADYLQRLPDEGGDLAVVIAQHVLDALDASSFDDTDGPQLMARAVDLLEKAAARARLLGAPAEAHRLLETAISREDDEAERARLQLLSAEAAYVGGRYQVAFDSAQSAKEAFDRLDLTVAAGHAAGVQGMTLMAMQDNTGAVEICEPRFDQLAGTAGAEEALIPLVRALGSAHGFLGNLEKAAFYGDRGLLLAEAAHDPVALASAQVHLAIHYQALGALVTARALASSAAQIARDNDKPIELAIALINLATIQLPYDLAAAIDTLTEATESARRSGSTTYRDYATGNYALALWTAGRMPDLQALLDESRDVTTLPAMRLSTACVEAWLADATGLPLPPSIDTAASDAEADRAWLGNLQVAHALAAGAPDEAARIARSTIESLLGAAGIEDDFMHLWPPLVAAALAAHDLELAERLLEPVRTAVPGSVSPAVNAQYLRLRGLVGARRGDEPLEVEADLRAGIDALTEFGAVGQAACASEELARWLLDHGRATDAEPLLEQARLTYEQIGARGWLQRALGIATA